MFYLDGIFRAALRVLPFVNRGISAAELMLVGSHEQREESEAAAFDRAFYCCSNVLFDHMDGIVVRDAWSADRCRGC